mgnify:CR=1 FL=1
MPRTSNLGALLLAGIVALNLAVNISGERWERYRLYRSEVETLKVRLALAMLLLSVAIAVGTIGWMI